MTRNIKILFIGGIVMVMLLFVWLTGGGSDQKPENQQQRRAYVSDNWSKRFQLFDKNPMGLYLFNTLAQAHLDSKHKLEIAYDWIELDSIIYNSKEPKTYLFVGNHFGLRSKEMDTLIGAVENGSDLFLSYNGLTENLYPYIFHDYGILYDYAESENVFDVKGKKYHMLNIFQKDTVACEWKAFDENVDMFEPHKSLSSFMELDNFLVASREKGEVFVHSNPMMFYNYQIQRKDGFRYTNYVLNQLPKDQDIVLLELGRLTDNFGDEDVDEQEGEGLDKDNSFLRRIFDSPQYRTALLVAILGFILYIIFRTRRKRPVVPYKAPKKDMTLAFAETITSIYYSKRNPYVLLQIQRKNFYAMMQKHFFIDLQRREGDRAFQSLAEKSNRSVEEIKSLVAALETSEAGKVTEQTIIQLAKRQRKFYRDVGIISDQILERVDSQKMTFKRSLLLPSLMISFGVILILLGFYFLTQAVGVGIVLWPAGIVLVALGILRVINPFMVVDGDEITYYSPYARKRKLRREDLVNLEIKASGVVFYFTDKRNLIINYWDLSRFDRKQFERFISKLHTLDL